MVNYNSMNRKHKVRADRKICANWLRKKKEKLKFCSIYSFSRLDLTFLIRNVIAISMMVQLIRLEIFTLRHHVVSHQIFSISLTRFFCH